jgi:hypothetical protein
MPVVQILEATLLGMLIGTFTDWYFGGVLFHSKYQTEPQIWRAYVNPAAENQRVAWAVATSILTFGGFALLYTTLGLHAWSSAIGLGVLIWIISALPLLLTQALFIRLHPATTFAHSAGWLVKLLVAAASSALLIR